MPPNIVVAKKTVLGCEHQTGEHKHNLMLEGGQHCPFSCFECGLRIAGSDGFGPACVCRPDLHVMARVAAAYLVSDKMEMAMAILHNIASTNQERPKEEPPKPGVRRLT